MCREPGHFIPVLSTLYWLPFHQGNSQALASSRGQKPHALISFHFLLVFAVATIPCAHPHAPGLLSTRPSVTGLPSSEGSLQYILRAPLSVERGSLLPYSCESSVNFLSPQTFPLPLPCLDCCSLYLPNLPYGPLIFTTYLPTPISAP